MVSFISVLFHRITFSNPEQLLTTVFPAFIDTLIPADQTPSATELQVDKDIIHDLKQDKRYLNICLLGCVWLDKTAQEAYQQAFSALNFRQRSALVKTLAEQKNNETAQFFFQYVRDKSFEYYYSKPQSWSGLGFNHPPQPLGYADYDQRVNHTS